MPSSSKPRHKRRIKTTGNRSLRTLPWQTHAVFRPLEAILDELETHGTLTVVAKGTQAGMPVFQPTGDNEWYAAAPALRGLIEMFELHEGRTGKALPLEPLRLLAKKMEVDMPIFSDDTKAIRACMPALVAELHTFPKDYAKELVQVTQTAVEFERLEVTA
ncbi:hypothetical protein [Noviherbaspirillum sp. Root189]|uniref:hypothetical protein n=1 Tax=Noviherbaspirillum sp. Root189 TaxID=1736487 RepID=UPI00070B10BF|nr:hypothetical protein [Noviherbaspirillum sp. Root189]KRB73471.1 hypothetical protein ASE07_06355 [Noviherbaspirillum sp. Root189]